jgi:hypothetical protein
MDQKKEQDINKDMLKDLVQVIYVKKGTNAYKTPEKESDVGLVKLNDVEKIFIAFKDKVKELTKKRMKWYHILLLILTGIIMGAGIGFFVGYYIL